MVLFENSGETIVLKSSIPIATDQYGGQFSLLIIALIMLRLSSTKTPLSKKIMLMKDVHENFSGNDADVTAGSLRDNAFKTIIHGDLRQWFSRSHLQSTKQLFLAIIFKKIQTRWATVLDLIVINTKACCAKVLM